MGEQSLFDVVDGALELGLQWLSVYAFSTENWRRPKDEVDFLMHVMSDSICAKRKDELHERGVRVLFAGRRDWRVPRRVLRHMDEAAELTRHNRRMSLVFAFNYGGRAEIVDAVRAVVEAGVPAAKIDERAIARHLYQPEMPDPDLVIRTSGEYRISNFLLWELAYSELMFTDVLWPDFGREQLFEAVRAYQRRDRRFGSVDPGDADGVDGRTPDGGRAHGRRRGRQRR
jgi:undecaprenyl diphosphate synthase